MKVRRENIFMCRQRDSNRNTLYKGRYNCMGNHLDQENVPTPFCLLLLGLSHRVS